jgi:hypothetical protein
MQAAGSASGDPVYVEDVFATHLYNGNSGSQSINNGIDLDGEGGLVWIKSREDPADHALYDTERNSNNVIHANDSAGQDTNTPLKNDTSNAFTSTGFDLNTATGITNNDNYVYTSWAFRKQTGFFDVVKWTGTGGNLTLSHNLGCVPGMILIKNTGGTHSWKVYHVGTHSTNPANFYLVLDGDNASASANNAYFQLTTPTATNFYVGSNADCNENGQTMIAYLFAGTGDSASQIFGDDGDEAIIKTGTFTTDSSGVIATDVDLGFEPQWLLVKRTDSTGDWNLFDTMRGFHGEKRGENRYIRSNTNGAEATDASADAEFITTTGFGSHGNGVTGSANATFIYLAIRRGPMKEPSAGTDVFKAVNSDSDGAFETGFPVDCYINLLTSTTYNNYWSFRKLFHWTLVTDTTDASQGYDANGLEKGWGSSTYYAIYDHMTKVGKSFTGNYTAFCWRRYPKVFDIVQYKAAGAGTHTHSLKVVPEMILVSSISHPNRNVVYHKAMGNTKQLHMDEDIAETTGQFGDTTPTASVFTVSNNTQTGTSGRRYIAMLFASLDGICEVGSYTGTGNNLNVTGLGAAARWVMIKRTDATGGWFVYDTTRGIEDGNDPYHLLNTSSADVTNTDYIDPHSSGFTITSSAPAALNANGGTYIYLAYA